MPARLQTTPRAPIGDAAILAKTGKSGPQWFRLIDRAGGKRMTHKEIVAVLAGEGVPPWWQQMLTVTYEQSRGLRERHQTTQGYQAGVSKTIGASAATLYRAWVDPRRRSTWSPESKGITIRKATPAKSVRITWPDGTHVEAYFGPKGETKCQVSVSHTKLRDAKAVARVKKQWAAALERLAERFAAPRTR